MINNERFIENVVGAADFAVGFVDKRAILVCDHMALASLKRKLQIVVPSCTIGTQVNEDDVARNNFINWLVVDFFYPDFSGIDSVKQGMEFIVAATIVSKGRDSERSREYGNQTSDASEKRMKNSIVVRVIGSPR
jgi:hypothetical protein